MKFHSAYLIALMALISTAHAQLLTYGLYGAEIAAPAIVLNADAVDGNPNTNRHKLNAKVTATFYNEPGTYRVIYSLLDSSDDKILLKSGSFTGTTIGSDAFEITNSGSSTVSRLVEILPEPVGTLDADERYRITCTLQKQLGSYPVSRLAESCRTHRFTLCLRPSFYQHHLG